MIDTLLSFKTTFLLDNDPEDMSVQDTTDYAASGYSDSEVTRPTILLTQVAGVIDARLPNGNVFYDGNFGSPDIDRDVTDTKTGIVITKDANGNLLQGQYQVDYSIQVTDEEFEFPIVRIDNTASKNQVIIAGDWTAVVANQTNIDITGSTSNDGTGITFDTVSYDAQNDQTNVQLDTDNAAEGSGGTLEIKALNTYIKQEIYDFTYTVSEACILMSADCNKSELRSEDATDYSQYDTAQPVSRDHIVRYPVDLEPPIADIDQPIAIISVNPIYTNVWTSTIASTVMKTGSDGLVIQDVINGVESLDVQCDDQICTIFKCLENVAANFDASIANGGQSEIRRWGTVWDQIKGYIILYNAARSCGDAPAQQKYYDKIIDLASVNSCCEIVDTSKSAVSIPVQPLTSGGLTTIYNELVNQWLTGTGIPADNIGNDGDFFLRQDGGTAPPKGDVYQKAAGTWGSPIMNINGADGSDGTPGTNGTNGTDGTSLLFSDGTEVEAVIAGGGLTTLSNRSVSIGSNVLKIGDGLHILVECWRLNDSIPDQLNLQIGGNDLILDQAMPLPSDYFTYEVDITINTTTEIKVNWKMTSGFSAGVAAALVPLEVFMGSASTFHSNGKFTVTDVGAGLIIAFQAGSAGNTFTSQQMRVEHLKI